MTKKIHKRVSDHLNSISKDLYSIKFHAEYSEPIHSPYDFARMEKIDVSCILKSVLLARKSRVRTALISSDFALVCLPVIDRIDMFQISKYMEWKKAEVARLSELNEFCGYPLNGVSPLGHSNLSVFFTAKAFDKPTVYIGAGIEACEIKILSRTLHDIVKNKSQII